MTDFARRLGLWTVSLSVLLLPGAAWGQEEAATEAPAPAADGSDGGVPSDAAPQEGPETFQQIREATPDWNWTASPGVAALGEVAEIKVPAGYVATDKKGASNLLKAFGNILSGTESGLIAPEDSDWFVVFKFNQIGYVKDDEKDKIDADALYKHFEEGITESNKQRAAQGVPPMKLVAWELKPTYNAEVNSLEWALRLESEGHSVVNYQTKRLGRTGVMDITLVADPSQLQEVLPKFREVMKGYAYKSGETYGEFRAGDKIAEYGLTALVAGGALAVAAKSGLLGKLIKPLIIGVLALGGIIASFFKRIFGGGGQENA